MPHKNTDAYEFYTKKQNEAAHELSGILRTLDDAKVITLSDSKNKFSSNHKNSNKVWQPFVEVFLTQTPNLKKNLTYFEFIQNHKEIFSKITGMLLRKTPNGQALFNLLYEVMDAGLEKLFIIMLDRFVDLEIVHDSTKKPFNINDYKCSAAFGRSLVHCAVRKNNVLALKKLIELNANLEGRTNGFEYSNEPFTELLENVGHTPLEEAAMTGARDCMAVLIVQKININDPNCYPLHLAANRGDLLCCELLIKSGAEVNRKDQKGKIPSEVAAEKTHMDCAQFLAQCLACLSEMEGKGINPFTNSKIQTEQQEGMPVELDTIEENTFRP